jgi:hypothetical protein
MGEGLQRLPPGFVFSAGSPHAPADFAGALCLREKIGQRTVGFREKLSTTAVIKALLLAVLGFRTGVLAQREGHSEK